MSYLISLRKIAIPLAMFAVVALGSATVAQADVMFVGSGTNPASGQALAASVNFSLSGNILTVTLINTSAADVLVPSDVLSGVFFSSNVSLLTPVSALLPAGTTVFFGSNGGGNVGGEWGYGAGLAGAPGGATQGISSSGFGLFGGANFNGPTLNPPDALDGLDYGITSAADDPSTGNAGVTGNDPLIHNQVVFTLTVPAGSTLDLNSITNVSFQYGTALTEPNIPGVPEPTTMLLLGTGLVGLAASLRKRLRK